MKHSVSTAVKKFFEDYETNINAGGSEFITKAYGDPVMIAMPKGSYAFTNEAFRKMIPNRKQFFDATGLKSSSISSLEELSGDESFFIVKTVWNFHFEKNPGKPFDVRTASTYVLRKEGDSPRIIFQLDHEDLKEKIQGHAETVTHDGVEASS